MPRLAICSRDLHWQWINWTLLCGTMEVSMVRPASATIAQHVFQPALTGKSWFCEKLSPANGNKGYRGEQISWKLSPMNWVQGVTEISRKISRSSAPKKKAIGWRALKTPTSDTPDFGGQVTPHGAQRVAIVDFPPLNSLGIDSRNGVQHATAIYPIPRYTRPRYIGSIL